MLSGRFSDQYDSKILLVVILAALLVSSFVTGSQLVQPSMAQDLGQMNQQARERIGGAVGQLTGGNQTGNQSTGVLGQLGDQPRSMLAPTLMLTNRSQDVLSQTLTTTTNGTTKPPNIVFILVDNLPPAALPLYGNLDIKTPNIDALAEQGITFTNAYSTNGICSPTRASVYTGLMPSQHGVHEAVVGDLPLGNVSLISEFKTFPEVFKEAGYNTSLIGKWHLGSPELINQTGFDNVVSKSSGSMKTFYNNSVYDNGKIYDVYDDISDFFTQKAVDYIDNQSASENPFLLTLTLPGPYWGPLPNWGPDSRNPFYDYYYNTSEFKSFPRTGINTNVLDQLRGIIPTDISNKSSPNLPMGASPEQLYKQILTYVIQSQNDRAYMANLAGQVALIDYNVGKVMNALKNTGLDNNTLVVFGSDNSMFMGEHGLNSHNVLTNPAVLHAPVMKVPLVISQPGIIATNKTSDMMISETDYAPTLMEYAGVTNATLPNSPGESFVPYLKGEQLPNWKTQVAYEQEESRGISTKDYQYVKRINGTGNPLYINEFYNLTSDPEQNINEYNNSAYSGIIKQLDANLTEFFEKYSDPKYNPWEGGAPKLITLRENVWKNLWGESWAPISDQTESFDSFAIN